AGPVGGSSGGYRVVVGAPSGGTLAPDGGARQPFNTPAVGMQVVGVTSWEPAFAQDLEWTLLEAMGRIGRPGGESAYFRLSTRPVDQALARVPDDALLRERRRQQVVAGGYRITEHPANDDVTLVGVGAIMTEVCEAAERLADVGVTAGIVCLTSPGLVFTSLQDRRRV